MQRISRRSLFSAATGLAVTGFLAACGAADDKPSTSNGSQSNDASQDANDDSEVVWHFSSPAAMGTSIAGAMDTFGDEIKERTSGRITCRSYPSSQLGGPKDALQGAQLGRIELAMATPGWLGSIAPDFGALNLPYLAMSMESMLEAVNGDNPFANRLRSSTEAVQLKSFGSLAVGARHIGNSRNEVTKVADLDGMKLRMQGDPVFLALGEALGTNVVSLEYAELYLGLQQGTIDAQDNGAVLTWTDKFWEVADYYTLTSHVYDLQCIVMNMATWQGLSDDDKQSVTDAFDVARSKQIADSAAEIEEAVNGLKDNITVTELSDEAMSEFVEIGKGIYPQFTSQLGEELIQMATDALA